MEMTKYRQTRIATLKTRFPSRNKSRKQGAKTVVSRDCAQWVAENVLERSPEDAAAWLRRSIMPALPLPTLKQVRQKKATWYGEIKRLAQALDCIATGQPGSYSAFNLEGNSKLPFAAFSALPGITCPGAGACLSFCYSYKAWRYPSAFCRQVYSTMALKHSRETIADEFRSLPKDIHVRLYVDGDFDSLETLAFWMELVSERSDLKCYGYSKSWDLFVEHSRRQVFPANYVLNLSSGSRHESSLREAMGELRKENGKPLVRGDFVAVGIDGRSHGIPRGHKRYKHPDYHRLVRESASAQYGRKAFSCPGDCGNCGVGLQVCGNEDARVLIAIGIH